MKKDKHTFLGSSLFPLLFLLLSWIIFFYDARYNLNLYKFGLLPRDLVGLTGVFFTPILHGDIQHILSNTFPILILGTFLFYYYKEVAFKVFFVIYFLSGILVWIFGNLDAVNSARAAYHIGASGLVYGLASFLFLSGIFKKHKALFGVSLLVTFLYGTIIWGMFPFEWRKAMHIVLDKENISWEGHLFGFLTGVGLAIYYRKKGIQEPKYSWEITNDVEVDESNPYWMVDETGNPISSTTSDVNEEAEPVLKNNSDNPYTVNYTFVPKPKQDGSDKVG